MSKSPKGNSTKVTEPEVEPVEPMESLASLEEVKALVIMPYRVRRADVNNIVIEKLKKRVTSEDTYWDVEGYYNNTISALSKLFYKEISANSVSSIRELTDLVKVTESRILSAIKDFKL